METTSEHHPHIINGTDDTVHTLHVEKNLYPYVRHVFLIMCVLFALSVIIFLIYQNGKSIYDNGI